MLNLEAIELVSNVDLFIQNCSKLIKKKRIAFKNKFVALGGINKINIKKTKMLDVYGISGISMYKKKPAFFKAGFHKF